MWNVFCQLKNTRSWVVRSGFWRTITKFDPELSVCLRVECNVRSSKYGTFGVTPGHNKSCASQPSQNQQLSKTACRQGSASHRRRETCRIAPSILSTAAGVHEGTHAAPHGSGKLDNRNARSAPKCEIKNCLFLRRNYFRVVNQNRK